MLVPNPHLGCNAGSAEASGVRYMTNPSFTHLGLYYLERKNYKISFKEMLHELQMIIADVQ